jgi:hypothetical protein
MSSKTPEEIESKEIEDITYAISFIFLGKLVLRRKKIKFFIKERKLLSNFLK